MSAIGLYPPRCTIAAHADYRRDHFIFGRTQSAALHALEWEGRLPRLRSWSDLLLPWAGLAALLAFAAVIVL